MIHWESGEGKLGNLKEFHNWFYHLPGVGLRIIRSLFAVLFCFVIFSFLGNQEGAFISSLVALQCVGPYTGNRWKLIKERFAGTGIGAIWGFLVVQIFCLGKGTLFFQAESHGWTIWGILIIVSILGVVLYSTVAVNLKNMSYYSCMVYLSIVVTIAAEKNAFLFTAGRVLEIVVGILMAMICSFLYLPRAKNRDILFVSGIDDTLLTKDEKLPPYSRVELNRMIDDGAKFTLSTLRTPASLIESVSELHLTLPVIVMDGAALYNINEKSYLLTYMISYKSSERIIEFLEKRNLNLFINVVIDDLLVIYYDKLSNEAELDIFKRLKKSPYRNYVNRRLPENENVVYFMLIHKKEKIADTYQELMKEEWISEYKVLTYDSDEYPGYAYIKIYNKEATRENMLRNLKAMLDFDKSVTFGSIPGKYDVLIEDSDHNTMVKKMKKVYEPIRLFFRGKS
ncbi:HAD hydrolase family protein [Lacrimispora xylanolytica]|uniref:HAD hydrolase family protein n=1 Tax=Lacrimispora xylanolytica TaxID=29375 RepID=A0ABY7AB10_9FIRM|nr:HAD hydrolase family protein [Lacrimispora xylanolytica]WAJ22938.1 HAD hydrolase family protein [Lacrimispora xylanolytica]